MECTRRLPTGGERSDNDDCKEGTWPPGERGWGDTVLSKSFVGWGLGSGRFDGGVGHVSGGSLVLVGMF